MTIFSGFIIHILIAIFVTTIGIYAVLSLEKRLSPWVLGVLFGCCTILVMINPIVIQKGRLLDFRFIVMMLAGYVGGPITALVSALISASFRLFQGGAGVLTGVITIFTFGCAGCLLRKVNLSFRPIRIRQIATLLGLGFAVAAIVLLIVIIVPPSGSGRDGLLRSVVIPFSILSPIATIVVFLLYDIIRERLTRLSFFESLLQSSSLMLFGVSSKGIQWASDRLANDFVLSQHVTNPSSKIFRRIAEAKSMNDLVDNIDTIDPEFHIADDRIISVKLSPVKLPQNDFAVVGVLSDITERERTQKELSRLDRLNLIGEMAAAIGHEIRNPMTTVRGFLQFLRDKDEPLKYREYFDLMIEEIDRANAIITRFLGLSKDKAVQLDTYSLKQIVQDLFPLIHTYASTSGNQINLELKDVPKISLDREEIVQVILNLARNAIEAMPHGGKITIKTTANEDEILLTVQDEGKGMEPKVLEKIGTPFFTTKENGTGLGLAVCYSIAARHNAKIDIESNDNGTSFCVRFKRQ